MSQSETTSAAGGRARLTLDLSNKLNQEVERLAAANGVTKDDVLRFARELLAKKADATFAAPDQVAAAYEARVKAVPEAVRRFAEETWGKTWAHAEMGSLLDFAALAAPTAKGGTDLRREFDEYDITQDMIQAGRYAANLNDGTLARIYLAMRAAEIVASPPPPAGAGGKTAGEVAGEAHQVIGTIAEAAGFWGRPEIEAALKYFGYEGWAKGDISPFVMAEHEAERAAEERLHVRRLELEEIRDGAYGDNPMTRGIARDALAKLPIQPPPPAGAAGGGSGDLGALSAGVLQQAGALISIYREAGTLPDSEEAQRISEAYDDAVSAMMNVLIPIPDLGAQGEPVAWDEDDAEINRILALSEDEVRAELVADGHDPDELLRKQKLGLDGLLRLAADRTRWREEAGSWRRVAERLEEEKVGLREALKPFAAILANGEPVGPIPRGLLDRTLTRQDLRRATAALVAPTPPSGVETIRQDNTSGGL